MASRGSAVLHVHPGAFPVTQRPVRILRFPFDARRSERAPLIAWGPLVATLALVATLVTAVLTGRVERTPSIRHSTALGLPHANR